MKQLLLFIGFVANLSISSAQNTVGIGTATPNPATILHVDAGTNYSKGLLVTGSHDFDEGTVPNFGAGSRLMFYPGKTAFRVGYAESGFWNNNNIGFFSMGMGYNTLANGNYSTAMGYNTTASGLYATSLGFYTMASGENSTALGVNATASGNSSFSLGSGTATGNSAMVLGSGTATGISSIALGSGQSSGLGSIAIGGGRARGNYSIAMGILTMAKAHNGFAIGAYNDTTDMPDASSPVSTDRIFQIGNGSSYGRDNALTILRNGNTGMGEVLNPAYRLDVDSRIRIRSGGIATSSAGIWLNKNDNSGLLGFVGVDGNNDIGIFSSASNWSFLVNTSNGNAWVKGTVTANGVTLTSDERLKKDITPLGDAMPLLEKLNGYQYHWKDETWDATLQTGLLAQEVEKVLPELVKTDDKGMKSVNYMGLMPYLLEATKEQQAIILKQQSNILEQQSTMLQLQTQLNDLKKLVKQLAGK